ncbi:MAG: hypothetical protein K0Q57_1046 [Gammaproteobacteria bacterium]|nr:hypothetical protein [Gammaproteobacteria bacterium]
MPTSGKSVVFEQKYMPSTGDCAFAAFANNLSLGEINRVRADVSETLLGLKQDPESRKFLADEIAELYIAKQFDSRNTAGEGASLFSPKTEVSDHAKLMATTFTTSTKLNDEIARAAFLKNCRTESLYSHYVQSLSDRNWLGLKSAQLYAKEKGIELYIWRKLNNSSQLSLEVHQAQLSPNRVLHLLYTGGFSHFDRLEPRPEPVNTLQESKEQPLMTASAFRTANIRARALAKSSERKESAHIA